MNSEAIIRAWKDPTYRANLSPQERAEVPENPSGSPLNELDDSDLGTVQGGLIVKPTSPNICPPRTFAWECFRTGFFLCPMTV
jgi:mersacidin/lichenicidin family type 2 lantibiotic